MGLIRVMHNVRLITTRVIDRGPAFKVQFALGKWLWKVSQFAFVVRYITHCLCVETRPLVFLYTLFTILLLGFRTLLLTFFMLMERLDPT